MSQKVLEARNISKTYKGEIEVKALKKTSIIFERGEFCAIIGKSGSGKSTLLRCLATLDVPDEGEIYIDGELVTGKSVSELQGKEKKDWVHISGLQSFSRVYCI